MAQRYQRQDLHDETLHRHVMNKEGMGLTCSLGNKDGGYEAIAAKPLQMEGIYTGKGQVHSAHRCCWSGVGRGVVLRREISR